MTVVAGVLVLCKLKLKFMLSYVAAGVFISLRLRMNYVIRVMRLKDKGDRR
jgi:hypothetical protein